MLKTFSKISLMCVALSMAELVYSSASNTVIDQVEGFTNPYALVGSLDGSKVYVTDVTVNTVSVIDVASNTIIGDPISVGTNPGAIAINPAGTFLYVTNTGSNNVSIIRTSDNIVTATVTVGTYPQGVTVNNDGSRVYVANTTSQTISFIDTTDNSVEPAYAAVRDFNWLALSPDGDYLYATDTTANVLTSFTVNSDGTCTPLDTISPGAGSIGKLVISPDGLTAYVVIDAGVMAVDLTDPANLSRTIISNGTYLTSPSAIAISSDGSTVYVSNTGAGTIAIINTATNEVTGIVDNNGFTLNTPVGLAMVTGTLYMYSADLYGTTLSQIFTFVPISAPATITGVSQSNVFFTQTDYINTISWTVPTEGTVPTSYNIYRDADLTNLAGTVLATSPLVYYDHNRIPGVTYIYYVVSVDADDAESSAISVSVTTKNN